MKKNLLLFCLLIPFMLCAQTAKIKIDIDRVIDEIDPKIYGVFMEPISFNPQRFGQTGTRSNTLYGTLYDPRSPVANEDGFRTDYINALKDLKLTNMRWPGGNYVAGYNWMDGIGPKDQRPVRKELAWNGIDSNQVGTDEWIKLNKALGTQNVICINLGTGSLDDARYWVEYCNAEAGTAFANLRVKYGNPKPYQVKYWCLGNEVDGEPWIMGYKNVDDYCKIAKEAAKLMRYTDSNLSFVANGSSYYEPTARWIDWNQKVITEFRDIGDYLSIHRYWERSDDYYVFMGDRAMDLEEKISVPAAQIEAARIRYHPGKTMYLSVDEWAGQGRGFMPTLAAAQYLNAFIRHADVVKMANFTLLTSLLGRDMQKGIFKTPLYYTFKLFSNNCLGKALDVAVVADTFNTANYKGMSYLDVSAAYSGETGSVIINVVNRHKDKSLTTEIINTAGSFSGKPFVSEVNTDDLNATFSFDKQQQYIPLNKDAVIKGNKIVYSFPPHSFSQIIVKVN